MQKRNKGLLIYLIVSLGFLNAIYLYIVNVNPKIIDYSFIVWIIAMVIWSFAHLNIIIKVIKSFTK